LAGTSPRAVFRLARVGDVAVSTVMDRGRPARPATFQGLLAEAEHPGRLCLHHPVSGVWQGRRGHLKGIEGRLDVLKGNGVADFVLADLHRCAASREYRLGRFMRPRPR